MKYGDVVVGAAVRLGEGCIAGRKIAPIECESSRRFYESHGSQYHGWNFRYEYWNGDRMADDGLMSIGPDTEVILL